MAFSFTAVVSAHPWECLLFSIILTLGITISSLLVVVVQHKLSGILLFTAQKLKAEVNKKNILVTGGSKGLGRAVAEELCRLGANVTIMARNQKGLDEVCTALQPLNCVGASCDLTKQKEVKEKLRNIIAKQGTYSIMEGKFDWVICNAGVAYPGKYGCLPARFYSKSD